MNYFADASVDVKPGEVKISTVTADQFSPAGITHHMKPSALLATASELFGQAPPAKTVVIGAASFELGMQLTAQVRGAVSHALRIEKEIAPYLKSDASSRSRVRFLRMTPETKTSSRQTAHPLRWIASSLIGALLTVLIIAGALWAITGFGILEFGRILRGGQIHLSVDQPTVIRQIRALRRLETVSYTMDKIIVGERENPVLPKFLAGDRLLLVVHGEAIAGVDLSKLQSNDVEVHERTVTIHLPQAEIFTTRLDSTKTRVYSRDTGIFSTPDPNLEGDVRQEAERQLQAAALQDGILKSADQNAKQTVSSLLTGLGFSNVQTR